MADNSPWALPENDASPWALPETPQDGMPPGMGSPIPPAALPPSAISHEEWLEQNPQHVPDREPFYWMGQMREPIVSAANIRRQHDPEGWQAYEELTKPAPFIWDGEQIDYFGLLGHAAANEFSVGLADDALEAAHLDDAAQMTRAATQYFVDNYPRQAEVLQFVGPFGLAQRLGKWMGKPQDTGSRVRRGIAGGYAEGQLYGFGHSDPQLPFWERMGQGTLPAAITALTGGTIPLAAPAAKKITSAVSRPFQRNRLADPATSPFARFNMPDEPSAVYREASQRQYQLLDESGIFIPGSLSESLEESFDAIINPRKFAKDRLPISIREWFDDHSGAPMSFSDLEGLRQRINGSLSSISTPNEQRVVFGLLDELDRFINNLEPGHLLQAATAEGVSMTLDQARAAALEARQLWNIANTLELVEAAYLTASRRVGDTPRQIRTELSRVAQRHWERFSEDERKILYRIINDPAGQMARTLAWLAPRGWAVSIPITAAMTTGNLAPLIPMAAGHIAHVVQDRAVDRLYARLLDQIGYRGGLNQFAPVASSGMVQGAQTLGLGIAPAAVTERLPYVPPEAQ